MKNYIVFLISLQVGFFGTTQAMNYATDMEEPRSPKFVSFEEHSVPARFQRLNKPKIKRNARRSPSQQSGNQDANQHNQHHNQHIERKFPQIKKQDQKQAFIVTILDTEEQLYTACSDGEEKELTRILHTKSFAITRTILRTALHFAKNQAISAIIAQHFKDILSKNNVPVDRLVTKYSDYKTPVKTDWAVADKKTFLS